jgi:microcystin-dependent protein
MQGSAPMQAGQGAGLSLRDLGEVGGEQTETLLQTEMPSHSHGVQAAASGGLPSPTNNAWASGLKGHPGSYAASNPITNVPMNPFGTSITGGNLPHNNMPPFLALTFIISLRGVFPPRS